MSYFFKKNKGFIIFAHENGSGRASPRIQYVADVLNQSEFATFLVDLFISDEQESDPKVKR